MSTPSLDPVLATHIAERNAALPEQFPLIDADHYLEIVLRERAESYAAHMATVTISPDMVQWGLAMARKFGTYVKVHHFVADWFTALMILRYGEEHRAYDAAAVEAAIAAGQAPPCSTDEQFAGWPLAFSDTDRKRAADLLAGVDWPANVFTLLSTEA